MKQKILKKSIAIIMLAITLISILANTVMATEISSAALHDSGDCGLHLQYWNEPKNAWYYITTTFVTYTENGVEYPAYCLNKDLPGVSNEGVGDYSVNISTLLDDVRIWRVIINGYPYQSPSAMGVENKYDAFVATKQAIYCIIYGYEPATRYKGGDSRGTAIANKIVDLVNIGRYGTQTPYNTDVEVSKTGGFYEDGEYYSQNYKIKAPVETASYTITATNGLPEGALITNLSNNVKNSFTGSETFKVRIPKDKLNKDVNVTVVLRAKCKNYPVFFGATTVAGTQDYAITYDPYGDLGGKTFMNVATNTGKIEINKTDSDTNKAISGVVFGLYKEDGTEIGKATTNDKGIAVFQGLYQGIYTVKELKTDDRYVLNETEFVADVKYNKTTTLDIQNEYKKGNIKVYKVDKDNHKIRLGNVSFDLYSEEFDKVVGTYATNVNGELLIEDVRIGNYKLIEKNTGRWYNLADDVDIQVEWKKTEEITIENEKKKGQIKVIKTDGDTEYVLEGVNFIVEDSNGNIVDKITTDKNGEAITKKLAIDETYTVYEESTKKGYILSNEKKTVELEEIEIKTLQFENYKEKGSVKIIKKSSDEKNIEGINFKISGTSKTGEYFERIYTTNEKGEIYIDEILAGEYTIEELKNDVNKSYLIPKSKTITVENDRITEVEFFNKLLGIPMTGDISQKKIWIGVFLIASTSLIGIIILKKNKKKINEKVAK